MHHFFPMLLKSNRISINLIIWEKKNESQKKDRKDLKQDFH